MTESRENKNQMIILISKPHVFIQIGCNQSDYKSHFKTFNINLEIKENRLVFTGFMLPLISDCHQFTPFEDSTIKTLKMVERKLKNLWNENQTISELIIKIQKLFKIKLFQLNVNSYFDDSNLKPFSVDCIVDTVKTLNNLNIPEKVR